LKKTAAHLAKQPKKRAGVVDLSARRSEKAP